MIEPEILYEDEDVLAVNKPTGLIVHPSLSCQGGRYGAGPDRQSVSEWFAKKYPESKNVGEPVRLSSGQAIERPGIVHRIDRETSGVLLLAKTSKGHAVLKKQFQNREIEKIYHAFVYGLVKDDRGKINLPIGRSSKDFRKRIVTSPQPLPFVRGGERGRGLFREALTYFEVLKRDEKDKVTFLEAKPKTGRTHQIRVHFLALHHPVVCDNLYAPNRPALLGFNRLALHARSLTFKDVFGEVHQITAEYPEDFQKALKTIGFKP